MAVPSCLTYCFSATQLPLPLLAGGLVPANLSSDDAARLLLHEECCVFLANDLNPSTHATYTEHLKYMIRFLLAFGLAHFLWCPDEMVVCWAAAFFARTVAHKTVVNYLKGYKHYLRVAGWDVSKWHAWQVLPRVLRGIKRLKGDASHPKLPITPDILLRMVRVLPAGQSHLAIWVAMLVGFFAFLRKSHLCVDGTSLEWHAALLLRKHLVLVPGQYCVLVKVHCSKTVQFSQRTHTIVIQGLPGHLLDPYFWVKTYLDMVPAADEAPAFGYMEGTVYTPLSYRVLLSGIKSLISAIGLDPEQFAGHSLRRGGATYAFQCGVNPLFIRIQGDWNSDAWMLYIGLSEEQKRVVSLKMQRSICEIPGARCSSRV
jgi:hypothetical protein